MRCGGFDGVFTAKACKIASTLWARSGSPCLAVGTVFNDVAVSAVLYYQLGGRDRPAR